MNGLLPAGATRDCKHRLFCFPHAGGGAAAFHRWRPALPASLVALPLCLPGRETRIAEKPYAAMPLLVGDIADAMTPLVDRSYVVLGHSMGALVAFELAREIRRRGLRQPDLLIVAASRAPHRPASGPPIHNLSDQEFLRELAHRFDGIPPQVQQNQELLQMILPIVRADIRLLETSDYQEEPPLDMDILALGGVDDRAVSTADLQAWRRQTAGLCTVHVLPGGHFFLHDKSGGPAPDVLRLILEQLGMEQPPSL